MTSTAPVFDLDDLQLLLTRYDTPNGEEPRRPPWTWPALDQAERAALARMIDAWVLTYNHMHGILEDDLLPPCWRRHPALATELAVQLWHWYAAHLDPKATVSGAAEFYGRHLPGFRSRVDRLLGRSPGECRRGEHPATWRKDAEQVLRHYDDIPGDPGRDERDVEALGALHFAFSHLNDGGQR